MFNNYNLKKYLMYSVHLFKVLLIFVLIDLLCVITLLCHLYHFENLPLNTYMCVPTVALVRQFLQ